MDKFSSISAIKDAIGGETYSGWMDVSVANKVFDVKVKQGWSN